MDQQAYILLLVFILGFMFLYFSQQKMAVELSTAIKEDPDTVVVQPPYYAGMRGPWWGGWRGRGWDRWHDKRVLNLK